MSGAFDELLKNNDFKISLSDQVTLTNQTVPKSKLIEKYKISNINKQTIFTFNKIAMFASRKKSSTFDIKAKAYQYNFKEYLTYQIFSKPYLYTWAKDYLQKKLRPNYSLEKIIKKYKPSLVVFPLTGTESTSYELILLSKKYIFKTLFLVNGWDNLSSKAVFLLKPDFLGVWGPQQLSDAVIIQEMEVEKCFLLGCARYEDYFKAKNVKRFFPFKYIVYAGTQTAHDEITPLKLFDKTLEKLKITDLKIVYRPHPNREKRLGDDLFIKKDYKHTFIDPQVEGDYFGNKQTREESATSQNFPKLDYNTSLLKNAQFIVSPLSSLILEAAIFDVPSLIPANSDDPNPISPASHARWKHFKGADQIPGWFVGKSYQEIEEKFVQMVKQFGSSNKNNQFNTLSAAIKKYLYFDNRSYAQRLLEVVNIIQSI